MTFALLILNKRKEALVAKCTAPTIAMLKQSALAIDMNVQPEFLRDSFGLKFAPFYSTRELEDLIARHLAAPRRGPLVRVS